MGPARARISLAVKRVAVSVALLCLAAGLSAAGTGARYRGQVLYRASKSPVAGVLVELVEAEDDGRPTDEVLGRTHADAEGRFTVGLEKATTGPIVVVVSAVRESATTGGDRRAEGYEVKTHRTRLGFLPNPSPTKSNTILIERRRPGQASDDSDD